jgi:hypothetical protein
MEENKDRQIWLVAKQRAAFKRSLSSYFLVNTFLVGIWFFTTGGRSHFWPIWPILGWGLGVGLQYLNDYHGANFFSAEREYEKLKNNN